jgi:ribosomal-protein-alanine N-acetyltransferase
MSAAADALSPGTTGRLFLRRFTLDDARFIVELLNEPGWLRFIGDKHVRTVEEARRYLTAGPLRMYDEHSFGLFCVMLAASATPIGMCGLIKRPELDDVDLGFALLERFGGNGYAFEAASAVLRYAEQALRIRRVVAITALDNTRSIELLRRLGFRHEQTLRLGAREDDSHLFAREVQTMTTSHDHLTLQMLEWIDTSPRTYGELIEVWKTNCPRFAIWEDACSAGLVTADGQRDGKVALTEQGRRMLRERATTAQ